MIAKLFHLQTKHQSKIKNLAATKQLKNIDKIILYYIILIYKKIQISFATK